MEPPGRETQGATGRPSATFLAIRILVDADRFRALTALDVDTRRTLDRAVGGDPGPLTDPARHPVAKVNDEIARWPTTPRHAGSWAAS